MSAKYTWPKVATATEDQSLAKQNDALDRWAEQLAAAFADGRHLLAAGNGGSAAEAST